MSSCCNVPLCRWNAEYGPDHVAYTLNIMKLLYDEMHNSIVSKDWFGQEKPDWSGLVM